jgi:hypothetical protein
MACCSNCGAQIGEGDTLCSKCGTKLVQATPQPVISPPLGMSSLAIAALVLGILGLLFSFVGLGAIICPELKTTYCLPQMNHHAPDRGNQVSSRWSVS